MRRIFITIGTIIFGACVVNYLAFITISMGIGGSASLGKVENGHFYLGDHGKLTEVTQSVYDYSKVHEHTSILSFLIGVAALLVVLILDRTRRDG